MVRIDNRKPQNNKTDEFHYFVMDESTIPADEGEEEKLREMERAIDDFLLSIRENVSNPTDMQNEGACSHIDSEYDIISSDDCFEKESLPSKKDGPGIPRHVRKLPYRSFKNKHRMGKGNVKNYGKAKMGINHPREEWHRRNDRELGESSRAEHLYQESSTPRWRDESFSPSSEELLREKSRSPRSDCDRGRSFSPSGRNEQGMRRVSPNRKGNYTQQGEFIPRGRHEYKRNLYQEQMGESLIPPRWRDESFSPSSDEFQQERSRSPRSHYNRGRSFSPSGRKEHQGVRRVSPNRKSNYPQQRKFIPRGRHGYRRRNFCQEVDESSQDRYAFEERNYPHERTFASRSRSNDDGNIRHRELSRGSNSPIDWSESYDYDSDNDHHSNQSWRCEENRPYIEEDRDGQSATSLVTTILREAIAHNPDIATKVTEACLALINKPSDRPAESDYECDRDSWASYKEESGRVSPQSWRDSRSPSFTESLDASSSRSGFTRHSDRFHGHSKRSVLEHSISPDDRQAGRDKYNYLDRHKKARYSPDYKILDDTRSAAASETQRARKRSSSEHSKNRHEEEFDLKGAVSWSIRKIRKQCRREKSSVVRRALLSLLEVHEKECKMYMKKPEAHPDYKKQYRDLVDQKIKSIVDLGGDPNGYDFEQDWRKHWPVRMYKLFQESWNTKMHSCTSMLQQKYGSGSKSSHSSSRKSSAQQPHEKRRIHEQGSEEETVDTEGSMKKLKTSKRKLSEVTHSSLEDQQMCKKQEEMNNEIFSILKLLNHIKHRFKDCEASFDELYVKVMSLKGDSVAINDVLQGDLPLLEKIIEKLKETLKDVNLTLIQKAVIQETHERFRSFLKKSKEMNSHSTKNKEVKIRKKLMESMDTSMEGTEGEHQIPCHLTNSHSSVVSSKCGTSQQVGQPRRTLMEISLWGSSTSESSGLYTPENTNVASFLSSFSQDGIPSNREFTPDVISMEKHTNRPIRTLTEISLVGSSSTSSTVTYKHNVIVVGKDSDMTQPPPPGVTPPPPGVSPPPPGVSPPPPRVTPPPPGVTPPPPGVTPPLSSETPTPSSEIPAPDIIPSPSDIPTSPHGETLQIPGVTHQLPEVTPSCSVASPSCIKPPGISPSNSVTTSHCRVSAAPHSVATTSHIVTAVPHCVTPQSPHSVNPQPSSSTSDVALSSLSITTTTQGVSLSSSVLTHSQAPVLDSSSLPSAASGLESHSTNDETYTASQHLSLVITPSEQSCKPTKHIITGMASKTDAPPQPSKELLRSTIKDCFLSSSLPEENNFSMSKKEELLRIGTSAEESFVASVPSLSEEILKMFEIKPMNNDRIKSDEKGPAKMDNIGSSGIKSTAKKPIKITIPQFSKQKSMPELNPMADDQELL